MPAADRCLESLRVIESLWPSLLAAREPQSSTDGAAAPPGIEQARTLRQERAEVGSAGGTIKAFAAPCDLAVVMAIEDVELALAVAHDQLLSAQNLSRTCSRCLHPFTQHSRSSADRGRCVVCARCASFRLARVTAWASSWERFLVDTKAAGLVEFRLATARGKVEETLHLVDSGWLITALCPWCGGINDAMPGGSFTLRAFTPGAANETYVMCFNPLCDPPNEACGYRSAGRPLWHYEDLDWLANQLQAVDFRRRRKLISGAHVAVTGSEVI